MDKENSWVSSYWLNCIKEIIPKKKIQSGIQYAKKHKITEIQVMITVLVQKFKQRITHLLTPEYTLKNSQKKK